MIQRLKYLLVALSIFSLHCHSNRKGNAMKIIQPIRFTYSIDLIGPDGAPFNIMDSTDLAYFSDRTIMIIPKPVYHVNPIQTDSGLFITDSGGVNVRHFDYFVFLKAQAKGTLYSDDGRKVTSGVIVDSIWKKRIFFPPNIVAQNVNRLVKTTKEKSVLTEWYDANNKPDPSYADSVILEYVNDMKDVPFSFSSFLEQRAKMKLRKIQFINSKKSDNFTKVETPATKLTFTIAPTTMDTSSIFIKISTEKVNQ